MIQKVHVRVALLALLVLLSAPLAFSQQKERKHKSDATQSSALAASAGPQDDKKDEKNEGDPLFRGMKYRSIGPFRGGRSLTAAGLTRDPTPYYLRVAGGRRVESHHC